MDTVQVLGPLTLHRRDASLAGADIGTRKARTLLAVLALHGGRTVSIERLIEVLWPEAPPRLPADNVATLVSRLRAAYGADLIAGGRLGYRLGDAVGTDLAEAATLIDQSEARAAAGQYALAEAAAERALTIAESGGPVEDEPRAPWLDAHLDGHRDLLRRARHALASAALHAGDVDTAASTAQGAVDADPLDEAAYRLLMRARHAAGEPARALAAYSMLSGVLTEELGVDPAPETRALHVAILREQDLPAAPDAAAPDPVVPARPAAGDRTFVGRDAEIAVLSRQWSAAAAGQGSVVVLSGEAGIGKTRLTVESATLARLTGGLVITARCYESERSLFLQPIVEALTPLVTGMPVATLRSVAGVNASALATLIPELASILGTPDRDHGTPDMQRRLAYTGLVQFLCRMSVREPVLLVLDDLHNAGLATVEFLHYLARHCGSSRILAVATMRSDEGREALATLTAVATVLPVGPMAQAAIGELAARAGHAELAAEIGERTRGHTLFVVETLRALSAGEPGIPASLREAILSRVARAGPDAEDLLRAAACLGADLDPVALSGLLDTTAPEAARQCERVLPTGLLTVSGRRYELGNDLIREVLYDTTPLPTRVAYHRRAADLLVGNPEAVGAHAAAAGDWLRAARAWLLAGESAIGRHAIGDAEALLDAALAAAEQAGDLELAGRARLFRGRCRETAARYADAMVDFAASRDLAREAGDGRLRMLALRGLAGPASTGSGMSATDGTGYLLEGLYLAEMLGDRAAEAELLGWLAVLSGNQLRFDLGVGYGERALRAGRAAGDDRAVASALDGLKSAYAYLGEIGRLVPVLEELEPLARRLGDLWLLQWCLFESAFPLIATGDWAGALTRIEAALTVNRRSGHAGFDAWFTAHLAWVARLAGRLDDALAIGARALAMETHPWWTGAVAGIHGGSLIEAGRVPEAAKLLEAGLASSTGHGTEAYRLRCLAPLAEITGSPALLIEADAMLRAIGAPPDSVWLYGADTYVAVAGAHLAAGRPERAREIVAPLLAAGERTGWRAPLAGAVALAGRTGLQ